MRDRALKKELQNLLSDGAFPAVASLVDRISPAKALNPLISLLCSTDELLKFRAIEVLGQALQDIANQEMEDARVVMRRFMWMLNDESGGIGWGVPEAMAEAMCCHQQLAEEYAHILVANMREEGNFLELEMLQRGLMWGLGRLAERRVNLMSKKNAGLYLPPYLNSPDPMVRGRAAFALGHLQTEASRETLQRLTTDPGEVTLYRDHKLVLFSVGELASQALLRME
ncbi:MAG: HEAT repeat domain-containing protein [Proteobacteria bacterium]|nr:HEAT repeat domain-containing protein [Pseudomonadota bacterium]MBU1687665.1 HEAT repeat domain-containing protein [Pseudomonadota bacterium]